MALFHRRADRNTRLEIILWWELRRIPFNLIVGACGVLTCLMLFMAMPDSENAGSPFLAIGGIFAYGTAANICYTGGWIGEVISRWLWRQRAEYFGQLSFIFGLIFSMLVTLAPSAFFAFIWLLRLAQHK